MSTGKKITLAAAVLLGLPILLLIALVALVDPNDYKPLIQQKAAEQGVQLNIGGEIGWSFLPRPAFIIAQLDAVLPGEKKQSVHIGELNMALALSPLLLGRVEIANISLRDGNTTLQDASGKATQLQGINLNVQHLNIDGAAFPLEASLTVQQDALQLQLNLQAQASAQLAQGLFNISNTAITVQAQGAAIPGGQRTLQIAIGDLRFDRTADTLAVDALHAQLGDLQLNASANLQTLSTALQAQVTALNLRAGTHSDLSGELSWHAGTPNRLTATLQGTQLDIDQLRTMFSPAPATDQATTAENNNTTAQKSTSAQQQWPLQNLFVVAADLRLTLATLQVNHMIFNNLQVHTTTADNTLRVETLRANAYQGEISSTTSLSAKPSATPQLRLDANIKQLQLAPLLTALQQAPSKIAAGSLTIDTQLTATPINAEQLLKTLSGALNFAIDGLIIDEVNLEQRSCEAAAQLDGKTLSAKQWPARTEFREARGSARLRNGVANIAPLTAKLDSLDLSGNGPVDLVSNTLDLALDLKLVNQTDAANFCEVMNPRLAKISWPLRCEGNYLNESGKQLCGIDKSRLDKLLLQAAQGKLLEKLEEKGLGDKIRGWFQ